MPVAPKTAWGAWIPANHPQLRWEGRLRFDADRNAIFDWASVRLHFAFEGPAFSLYAHLGRNYVDVLVDGRRVAVLGRATKAPSLAWEGLGVRPQASGGTPAYRVQGLGPGRHQVVLAKRTGPQWAEVTVLGLRLEAQSHLLDAPAAEPALDAPAEPLKPRRDGAPLVTLLTLPDQVSLEARAELAAWRGPLDFEVLETVLDEGADPALRLRYQNHAPVAIFEGEALFNFKMDENLLALRLRAWRQKGGRA